MQNEKGSKAIRKFAGRYAFLSNFFPCTVMFSSEKYPSSEHAFQAAKTFDKEERKIFQGDTYSPAQAKKAGRSLSLRSDWETAKIHIMYEICKDKFTRNADLKELLISTGDAYLEEGTTGWDDKFWGVADGEGRNELGKILMKIRSELQREIASHEHYAIKSFTLHCSVESAENHADFALEQIKSMSREDWFETDEIAAYTILTIKSEHPIINGRHVVFTDSIYESLNEEWNPLVFADSNYADDEEFEEYKRAFELADNDFKSGLCDSFDALIRKGSQAKTPIYFDIDCKFMLDAGRHYPHTMITDIALSQGIE